MKLLSLRSLLTPSALVVAFALNGFASAPRATAQTPMHIVADIPFSFRSGSEMMPAGKYDIKALSDHVLIVRNTTRTRSQIMLTNHAQTLKPSERGKLVFHRYGNKYFLYQVWSPGQSNGFELPKDHAEKEAVRASNTPAPSTTELALNEPPR